MPTRGSPAISVHRDDVVRALENRLSGIYNLVNDISESKEPFFGKICDAASVDRSVWLGQGTGPKALSNQKIKDTGYEFLDPKAAHDGEAIL